MGEINSKNCIDALQGSNLIKSAQASSGKSNIVVVNPEIHLHSNNSNNIKDTSGPMNHDRRIKALEAELKLKQDEIDLEKGLRQMKERERCAENNRINKLLREKENAIQDQNDLLSWHTDVVKEKRACLGEAYPACLYGQSDKSSANHEQTARQKRVRMDAHGTTTDGFQPANKKRKRKRNKKNKGPLPHHIDRSFTNSCRNALNYHSQRARSKTEINCENDPMELWEWNGTKWVAIETNDLGQNAKQFGAPKTKSKCSEPQKQNSVKTNVPSTTKICNAKSQTASTSKACDNGKSGTNVQLPDKVREGTTEEASKSVHCLDDAVNLTNLEQQHFALPEISLPSDFSISFDEREITQFVNHDATLFAMPKLTGQPS